MTMSLTSFKSQRPCPPSPLRCLPPHCLIPISTIYNHLPPALVHPSAPACRSRWGDLGASTEWNNGPEVQIVSSGHNSHCLVRQNDTIVISRDTELFRINLKNRFVGSLSWGLDELSDSFPYTPALL